MSRAQPPALRPACCVQNVALQGGPANIGGGARFYFYTNALKFTAEFIGRIALLDGFAQLIGVPQCLTSKVCFMIRSAEALHGRAGVILYNKFLRNIQLRTLFFWLTLVGVAAGFTQLVLVTGAHSGRASPACVAAAGPGVAPSCRACAGLNRTLGLSDKLFVLVDSVLLTGLGRIMMMPSLVLAARVCPEARTLRAWLGLCIEGSPHSVNNYALGASCNSSSTVCLPLVLADCW